ncbi:unnamed protein product, partial [Amoebophrya sp. A25]
DSDQHRSFVLEHDINFQEIYATMTHGGGYLSRLLNNIGTSGSGGATGGTSGSNAAGGETPKSKVATKSKEKELEQRTTNKSHSQERISQDKRAARKPLSPTNLPTLPCAFHNLRRLNLANFVKEVRQRATSSSSSGGNPSLASSTSCSLLSFLPVGAFPHVSEVCVEGNGLPTLDGIQYLFPSLRRLDASHN